MLPPGPAAALALVLVLALTACGQGDASDAAPTPSPSAAITGPGTDPDENRGVGDRFVEALAANTRQSLAEAAALTAPGSGADRYVERALAALTGAAAPRELERTDDGGFRLCAGDECSVLGALFLSDGLVASFTIDGAQVR